MALEFSGEHLIPAERQAVWMALNDPVVLQRCIAGCQQLDKTADHEFQAIVVAKVGPISATFRGHVSLSEQDPPRSYVLTGRGQGGAAGFASMSARVTLQEEGAATRLHYVASADIGGKLASVGSRLFQSVAKQNADDFFQAFSRQFGAGHEASGEPTQAKGSIATPDSPAAPTAVAPAPGGGLTAPVPAWVILFVSGISLGLGYCLALLK